MHACMHACIFFHYSALIQKILKSTISHTIHMVMKHILYVYVYIYIHTYLYILLPIHTYTHSNVSQTNINKNPLQRRKQAKILIFGIAF